jgi:hypothetical protein
MEHSVNNLIAFFEKKQLIKNKKYKPKYDDLLYEIDTLLESLKIPVKIN